MLGRIALAGCPGPVGDTESIRRNFSLSPDSLGQEGSLLSHTDMGTKELIPGDS